MQTFNDFLVLNIHTHTYNKHTNTQKIFFNFHKYAT